jgi:DNA-binding transcriptional MerR regulator
MVLRKGYEIMPYNTHHVQILYQITLETVRTWAQEFIEYLEPSANPGKGKTRSFSENDMQVMGFIAEERAKNVPFDEIHVALKQGTRSAASLPEPKEVEAMGAQMADQDLEIQLVQVRGMLELAVLERDKLMAEIQPVKDENIRLKAEKEAEYRRREEEETRYLQQIADRDRQIATLNRELGRMEEAIERLRGKESDGS